MNRAIELAARLQSEAEQEMSPSERARQEELAFMMKDPSGKNLLSALTDRCFRSSDPKRVASEVAHLIDLYGVPSFLSPGKRVALRLFKYGAPILPHLFVPLLKRMIRQEAAGLILPAESAALSEHIAERREEGVRVNLNHLGEAILGEKEAEERLQEYLTDLKNPLIDYVSVKISTLYSQINPIAWQETLDALSERYRRLLRAAGSKFVNLDMEEYKDLRLTVELFKKVLSEEEFLKHSAGIVLQAYLPESFQLQREITSWAQERIKRGGAPVKIRIVKGANLAMERVEASLKGWPQAPFETKRETDAQFIKMIHYGLEKEHARAVHIGVGSHNIFDIAYSLLLASDNDVKESVTFEMLEGMADPLRRVVQKTSKNMLLYCPVAKEEEFQTAVAYLIRRLDENTAPENFLTHSFGLKVNSKAWHEEVERFKKSLEDSESISEAPKRCQDRFKPKVRSMASLFSNEPDTDFSLPENRLWAEKLLQKAERRSIEPLPIVIGGLEKWGKMASGFDPSFPEEVRFQYTEAGPEDLEEAVKKSVSAFAALQKLSLQQRVDLLKMSANQLRLSRGELIEGMIINTGKTLQEADVEVSEAIDFADFYAKNLEELGFLSDVSLLGKGPVLVLSPWNFPISIPAGGIFAALAAGCPVLFKPAPEAVYSGWQLVSELWEAGVPKEFIQFIPCKDDPEGSSLVQDKRVQALLLTGSTSTAEKLNHLSKGFKLYAETGGKNAIIVTSMADRDLAIKDIIQSAFGHSGQKCSACSLVILLDEVYHDPHFKRQFKDAAESLKVGSAWHPASKVTPLIAPPSPHLIKAVTTLEEGEEWLLKPEIKGQLMSPGIKWGVRPGSFMHQTEFFAPLISVLRASSLKEAVALVNDTPYGLTSGIHSLDPREVELWKKSVVAGNLYVNRGITGAIVQRQPFGGTKMSQFGPGAKAGGPNYILQLMEKKQKYLPSHKLPYPYAYEHEETEDFELFKASLESYAFFFERYFSKKIDSCRLLGQDNYFYYVPHNKVFLRVYGGDRKIDIKRVLYACRLTSTPLVLSGPEESDEQFIERLKKEPFPVVRLLSPPSEKLESALKALSARVHLEPVLANGRLELLHYLREVSLSADYHRYGNLGQREGEERTLSAKPLKPKVQQPERGCCCEH